MTEKERKEKGKLRRERERIKGTDRGGEGSGRIRIRGERVHGIEEEYNNREKGKRELCTKFDSSELSGG
jgi:hypothetical protein